MGRTQGLLVVAIAALALTGCDDDDDGDGNGNSFDAVMNGPSERPTPVPTSATGNATVELRNNTLSVTGSFQGLTGAAVAAHIHGPADKETAAGILCALEATPSVAGGLTGSCTFTDEQVQQLRDGLMYVNVHTPQYPAGEIRGQLE